MAIVNDALLSRTKDTPPAGRSVEITRTASEAISILVFFSGCAGLLGRVGDIPALKNVIPEIVAMKANTALCFILTGAALWCLQTKRINSPNFRLTAGLSVSVLLTISLITPERIAFPGAICFILIGISLLFSSPKKPWPSYIMQSCALAVTCIAILSLIAYCYGKPPLYIGQQLNTAMPLHTTVLLILAAFGILFLRPDSGLMVQVTCDLAGGRMLRRILPVAILIPIGMELLKLSAERSSLFNNEFGVLLVIMGNLSLLTIFIYSFSVMLNRSDIKRKEMEGQTTASREHLEKIINAVADPIFVKDKSHRWVLFNPAFSGLMERKPEEIQGKSDHDFFPKEQADVFWNKDEEVFTNGAEVINKELFTNASGKINLIVTKKTLYTDNSGNKFIVGIIRDITDQKQAQEKIDQQERELKNALKESIKARRIMISMLEDNNKARKDLEQNLMELKASQNMLIQSEKLASLGRLISEIAHEVNNPLMIISGNAQLSLMSESINDEERNNLDIIIKECQRAKNVIRRVLRFSRPSRGELKEMDIRQSIESFICMLEKQFLLVENVQILRQYMDKEAIVQADEQQIQEVFMNLLNNAKEAMPEGGIITVTTSSEGGYLRIDFKDTGQGMPDDVLRKIMEPFFTTKETGTGLGLAICYGIIKAHKGKLTFTSKLGQGTVATILLPLMETPRNG